MRGLIEYLLCAYILSVTINFTHALILVLFLDDFFVCIFLNFENRIRKHSVKANFA